MVTYRGHGARVKASAFSGSSNQPSEDSRLGRPSVNQDRVYEYMLKHPKEIYNFREVARELGMKSEAVRQVFIAFEKKEMVKKVGPARWAIEPPKKRRKTKGKKKT